MNQEVTLETVSELFITHLTNQGKSKRTIYTYGKDLEQITAFFGPTRKLKNILFSHISHFYKSPELLSLPDGRERSPLTIQKTIRVLRMILTWAHQQGYLTSPANIKRLT